MHNAPMKPSGLGLEKPTQVEVMGIGSTYPLRMYEVFVFAGLLLEISSMQGSLCQAWRYRSQVYVDERF